MKGNIELAPLTHPGYLLNQAYLCHSSKRRLLEFGEYYWGFDHEADRVDMNGKAWKMERKERGPHFTKREFRKLVLERKKS